MTSVFSGKLLIYFFLYTLMVQLVFTLSDQCLVLAAAVPQKPFLIKDSQVVGSLLQWTVLNAWVAAASVLLTRQQA